MDNKYPFWTQQTTDIRVGFGLKWRILVVRLSPKRIYVVRLEPIIQTSLICFNSAGQEMYVLMLNHYLDISSPFVSLYCLPYTY